MANCRLLVVVRHDIDSFKQYKTRMFVV